jgi:lauroyl/myristoyl acyltransferase
MVTMALWLRLAPALRAGIARLPVSLSTGAVEAGARRYARMALRTRWLPLFRNARAPAVSDPGLVEDRFVLKVLNWLDEVRPLTLAPPEAVEMRGLAHLRAALATRRGVVLITGHFGFPPAIRAALEATGTPWLTLRQLGLRDGATALGTDPWARVRALRQARAALGHNHACLLLVDGGQGATTRVPFLGGSLDLSLGAFALARAARCPILPFFAQLLGGPSRLCVEIEAPLPGVPAGSPEASDAEVLTGAARAFAALYETYVRRYPSSRYWAGGR